MAEAHAHQGSAAPRKVGPARRIGPSLVCLQPHAIAPSCEAPTLVTSLPTPSTPACPDLAQLLHTAVAQAFNAVVITNAALEVVQEARPEIYAKGGDYDMTAIPEGRAVMAYGGQAIAIDFEHDRSTTKLLGKIRG